MNKKNSFLTLRDKLLIQNSFLKIYYENRLVTKQIEDGFNYFILFFVNIENNLERYFCEEKAEKVVLHI